jgi:nicotinamidase-related amidase
MRQINLSTRSYDNKYKKQTGVVLPLNVEQMALVLVDCDEIDANDPLIESIDAALAAARRVGMRVIYLHNAPSGIGGPQDMTRELHQTRHGRQETLSEGWIPVQPRYSLRIAPLKDEANISKSNKKGFDGTYLDYYLRTYGIDTVALVGVHLRSCLYETGLGARQRNYRAILLRDCTCRPGASEFPDTADQENPEGGWVRFVFLRMFEAFVGYTTGVDEFIHSLQTASHN